MSNTKRTAVITGATSDRGIGIDVARRYAREGWAVVILDLDGEKSAKVAAEIGNQFAVPAFGYAVDVTSDESVAAPRGRCRRGGLGRTCLRSARLPTSPASPHRSRSSRPRWSCGTR